MTNTLLRIFARLMYYPSLGYHDARCILGSWHRWDWIDDEVLLGRIPRKNEIETLHNEGIRAIINMCDEFTGHQSQMRQHNITQLRLPTIDLVCPTQQNLLRGIEFIQRCSREGDKVYIHCKAGRGRAATMALCHLIAKHRIPAEDAYKRLQKSRAQVDRKLFRRQPVISIEEIVRGGHLPNP